MTYSTRLSTTAGALAGAFHLDNCADDGVIAVVQLRSSQEPTELVPYDPTLPFCTGIHRVCDTCGAARMLSNPAARNRSYLLRDTHTCETLGYECDQAVEQPADLMLKSLGGLLDPCALMQECKPCGGLGRAGAALITLPTVCHRVPDAVQPIGQPANTMREVLFIHLVPAYKDGRDAADALLPYDRDKQYHISRLLDDTRLVDSNPSLANWTVQQYNMLGYDVDAENLQSDSNVVRLSRTRRTEALRAVTAARAQPASRTRSRQARGTPTTMVQGDEANAGPTVVQGAVTNAEPTHSLQRHPDASASVLVPVPLRSAPVFDRPGAPPDEQPTTYERAPANGISAYEQQRDAAASGIND